MQEIIIIGASVGKTAALIQAIKGTVATLKQEGAKIAIMGYDVFIDVQAQFQNDTKVLRIAGEARLPIIKTAIETASQDLGKAPPKLEDSMLLPKVAYGIKSHQPPHQRRRRNGK